MLIKITLKKTNSVIKAKEYWRLKEKKKNQAKFVEFFGQDKSILKKIINERINFLDDIEINLFRKLDSMDYSEANDYFQILLDKMLHLNRKMLTLDLFQYHSSHKWISKINFVEKFIQMLNNLFITSDEYYLELHRKYIDHFTETFIFWAFMMAIHTNCWEEALLILDSYLQVDTLSQDFSCILAKIKKKIESKYVFFSFKPIRDTENIKFYFSNINVVVQLFAKNLFFQSFRKLKFNVENSLPSSNIIKIQLQNSIDVF